MITQPVVYLKCFEGNESKFVEEGKTIHKGLTFFFAAIIKFQYCLRRDITGLNLYSAI